MSNAVPPRPSLVTHSVDFLRSALLRGEWGDVLPSERSLCARLRISRPTLRAVLAQLEREGVISAVIDKKRHLLAVKARASRLERPTVIALLSPVPAQQMPPFVLFWMDALRELLAEAGFQLEVHVGLPCYSTRPGGGLTKLTKRVPAAAWVLFRSTPVMQRWFADQHLPAVIAGSCTDGIALPSVDIDYRATCRHAASLLIQRGHRRIALLLPGQPNHGESASERGFREAFVARDATPVLLRHRETADSLVECLDGALRQRPGPTAFVVARSTHTLAVVTHLMRRGYSLPRDFALVSRDDDAFLDHVLPRITRYSSDPAKFALRLTRLVLELARTGHTSTRPVRLMPDLRRGETV